MKIISKMVAVSGFSLMALGISMSSFASESPETQASGRTYTTVTISNIPGGGEAKANLSTGNLKRSGDTQVTFLETKRTALLGNSAELVNSNQDARSSKVGLSLNKVVNGTNKGAQINYYYYAKVYSNIIEPNNNNDVTLQFSADKMN
ncbi:hypothetical protein BH747_00875 [Enterococcus villorum]|uniref:WxL domain-containing protein n=1 Tax=Enterococcus villorum TaxID=112904 RepID=A0A1V8YFK7_9ENTE|nr:hypothetical protein [Enterococcus villorum]OQO71417.1 hypothetical protein BH747_00875 [Enterococcus villorum]OQO73609.1 hypothetical protein BH744_09415 [Enterococcus villorum]